MRLKKAPFKSARAALQRALLRHSAIMRRIREVFQPASRGGYTPDAVSVLLRTGARYKQTAYYYAPPQVGAPLLRRFRRAELLLEGRTRQYDALLQPRRDRTWAKREEEYRRRWEERRDEYQGVWAELEETTEEYVGTLPEESCGGNPFDPATQDYWRRLLSERGKVAPPGVLLVAGKCRRSPRCKIVVVSGQMPFGWTPPPKTEIEQE